MWETLFCKFWKHLGIWATSFLSISSDGATINNHIKLSLKYIINCEFKVTIFVVDFPLEPSVDAKFSLSPTLFGPISNFWLDPLPREDFEKTQKVRIEMPFLYKSPHYHSIWPGVKAPLPFYLDKVVFDRHPVVAWTPTHLRVNIKSVT